MASTGRESRDPGAHKPVPRHDLIGGLFAIEIGCPLPLLGAGLPAFAVRDLAGPRPEVMALQVPPGVTPRPQAMAVLSTASIAGLATPLAHGVAGTPAGSMAQFVVCRAPTGGPLAQAGAIMRTWTEAELLACVLRPIAAVLAELEARGVTHRALRPDNVFQTESGHPVTLGAGWAAAPASLQPAAAEPPYVACCLEAGRGEGAIADDIYALGVLLLALSVGRMPLAGLDAREIVRRKLSQGSFAALVSDLRPPPGIVDLVRAMVAEDPEHRPAPSRLADPGAVRSRRLAVPPPRQAQRPLMIEGVSTGNARSLAGALAAHPTTGARLLRQGVVEHWLRRELADPTLAMRMEEAVRAGNAEGPGDAGSADLLLLVRAVAILDPLMPIWGEGVALWPDGLGAALLAADPALSQVLCRLVTGGAIAAWAVARAGRGDAAALRVEAERYGRLLSRRGWAGGVPLLRYALNPLAPCASPILGQRIVARLADLLPGLEEVAGRAGDRPSLPLDAEMGAFIVARQDLRTDRDIAALGTAAPHRAGPAPGSAAIAQVRVLARLQFQLGAGRLPKLAAWLSEELRPALAIWQSSTRRARMHTELAARAESGNLAAFLDLVDDKAELAQDAREAEAARQSLARLDRELLELSSTRDQRARNARHVGQEVTVGLGVIALSCTALWLAL